MKRDAESDSGLLIVNGLGRPTSVSVDWLARMIYVIDSKTNNIMATDMAGQKLALIVSTGPFPTVLKVDPLGRRLFWSTESLGHGIMTAGLDGSDKRVLIEGHVGHVTGFAIDYPADRLYWVDRAKKTVESMRLDEKDLRTVIQFAGQQNPISIDVFENDLSIALAQRLVLTRSKFGSSSSLQPIHGDHENAVLVAYHPLKQNISGMKGIS